MLNYEIMIYLETAGIALSQTNHKHSLRPSRAIEMQTSFFWNYMTHRKCRGWQVILWVGLNRIKLGMLWSPS
jgi:hypothetical protein